MLADYFIESSYKDLEYQHEMYLNRNNLEIDGIVGYLNINMRCI